MMISLLEYRCLSFTKKSCVIEKRNKETKTNVYNACFNESFYSCETCFIYCRQIKTPLCIRNILEINVLFHQPNSEDLSSADSINSEGKETRSYLFGAIAQDMYDGRSKLESQHCRQKQVEIEHPIFNNQ